jgi:hypothetical protein
MSSLYVECVHSIGGPHRHDLQYTNVFPLDRMRSFYLECVLSIGGPQRHDLEHTGIECVLTR